MYDADAIEAINFEQLVTVTDRLLLRGSVRDARAFARGSRPPVRRPSTSRIVPPRVVEDAERTIITRPSFASAIDATTVALSTAIIVVVMLIAAVA